MNSAARASRSGSHRTALLGHPTKCSNGGVTVSTGSIAAWEACRGVGTRNRLQKQSCQR